jgi:hypothetical protein
MKWEMPNNASQAPPAMSVHTVPSAKRFMRDNE